MSQVLWNLPIPATALIYSPEFRMLPKRLCALRCHYEGDDDQVVFVDLLFDGVEAFKCTYHMAVTPEMSQMAYGKVVDLGNSEWLSAVKAQLLGFGIQDAAELKHLVIDFDDGPCYESLCPDFSRRRTQLTPQSQFGNGGLFMKGRCL
jgi:hypothetical protein